MMTKVCTDDLFASIDLPMETRMLVAMLSDQIQSLGTFYRRGMWRRDPAELGDWLREQDTKVRKDAYLLEAAMLEWQLWGRATDVLIEVLERETIFRLDRGRLVSLARAAGSGEWSRGSMVKAIEPRAVA